MKIYFIGAGPGSPELITIKGRRLIEEAEIILYAGSLVNPELLRWAKEGAIIGDTSKMELAEMEAIYLENREKEGTIARIHTGDPSLYGAIAEQIRICKEASIPWEVVPGVSSFSAAAASLGRELTLPEISQTVILTRRGGRTPVPEGQSLEQLARSKSTMVLFLTSGMADQALREILPFYGADAPASAVYRASWEDEIRIEASVSTLARRMKEAGIERQVLILVGDALGRENFTASKLYNGKFTHGYRRGEGSEQ